MFKFRREVFVAFIMLLTVSLACSLVGNNVVRQSVSVSKNPKPNGLLNCSVTQNLPNNKNDWVKLSDEYYWYLNIIEQDKHNRMWLATDGHGLLMFDGKKWHNWQPENRNDMSDDALRTMAVSQTNIYVGAYGSSDGGNLLIYDIGNDKWQTISPGTNAMRNNIIGGLAINQTGQIYAMTKDGLDILDKGMWIYSSNPFQTDFIINIVDDALFDNEGNYWIATNDGIWKFEENTWTSYTAENMQLPSNTVNALDIDQNGRIWAATTSGLAVYINGKWFTFSPNEYPWYQGWLDNVAVDSQNRVWVTSNDILSVYNGKEAVIFTPDIIGESLWDNAIGFDKDGCVWVGTSLGLAIFQGKLDLPPGNYDFLK